jgi:FtsH-binding integral membrane protein
LSSLSSFNSRCDAKHHVSDQHIWLIWQCTKDQQWTTNKTQKTKDWATQTQQKPGMNWYASEWWVVAASLVATVVVCLLSSLSSFNSRCDAKHHVSDQHIWLIWQCTLYQHD